MKLSMSLMVVLCDQDFYLSLCSPSSKVGRHNNLSFDTSTGAGSVNIRRTSCEVNALRQPPGRVICACEASFATCTLDMERYSLLASRKWNHWPNSSQTYSVIIKAQHHRHLHYTILQCQPFVLYIPLSSISISHGTRPRRSLLPYLKTILHE